MTELSNIAYPFIEHKDQLEKYGPPGHEGTVNVRLCEKTFCKGFEMVLGEIAPGGEAHKHHHDVEYQAMYVLEGNARVTLADEPSVDCAPGTIVRLPPKLDHHVLSMGPEPLKLMIVYSPPLPKRNDVPVTNE